MVTDSTASIIIADKKEKGGYNEPTLQCLVKFIIADKKEKGGYNTPSARSVILEIIADKKEKGGYNSRPNLRKHK